MMWDCCLTEWGSVEVYYQRYIRARYACGYNIQTTVQMYSTLAGRPALATNRLMYCSKRWGQRKQINVTGVTIGYTTRGQSKYGE